MVAIMVMLVLLVVVMVVVVKVWVEVVLIVVIIGLHKITKQQRLVFNPGSSYLTSLYT